MKTLFLMRHAKSSWSNRTLCDEERPLNARGKRDAVRMGKFLTQLGISPSIIITSDAKRAMKTTKRLIKASGFNGPLEVNPDLYATTMNQHIKVLNQQLDRHSSVLLIAHNPTLEDLLSQLTGSWFDLKTATIAELSLPLKSWSELTVQSKATLKNIWYPREIK